MARLRQAKRWSRVWLSASFLCLGVSALIGYHQDQMAATTVLAQKAGPPPEVRIQDFDPEIHGNFINEMRVLAEIAFDRQVRLNVGSTERGQLVDIVPLFAVSRDAAREAGHRLGMPDVSGLVRPRARAEAERIREENIGLAAFERIPVGAILMEVAGEEGVTAADLGMIALGEGANGPLVSIRGIHLGGQTLKAWASDGLSAQGLSLAENAIFISPYAVGNASALVVSDLSSLRNSLVVVAFVFMSLSVIMALPRFQLRRRHEDDEVETVEAISRLPAVFQPIRTQEEIHREERSKTTVKARRVVSRSLSAG